jgi:hypothetical protein
MGEDRKGDAQRAGGANGEDGRSAEIRPGGDISICVTA